MTRKDPRSDSVVSSIAVNQLPDPIAELCVMLSRIDGVEAVTIGGSRAAGTADAGSDWDIGVYYRGEIDLASLARYGEVHPPGSWGRIMNGGAWLSLEADRAPRLARPVHRRSLSAIGAHRVGGW